MQLTDQLRQHLVQEFRFAATQMQGTEDPFQKLYYLSVFFGESQRILNWHWDRDLVLLHQIVTITQQQTTNALVQMTRGGERVVKITPDFMRALTQAAADLANWLEEEGDAQQFLALMGRFAELGYATTGNGYYLMTKGHLNLEV